MLFLNCFIEVGKVFNWKVLESNRCSDDRVYVLSQLLEISY